MTSIQRAYEETEAAKLKQIAAGKAHGGAHDKKRVQTKSSEAAPRPKPAPSVEQNVPKTPQHRVGSLRWFAESHLLGETMSHTHARRLLQHVEHCKIIKAVLGEQVYQEILAEKNGLHLGREQVKQLAYIAEGLPTNEVRALVDELRGMKHATLKARNQLVTRTFYTRIDEIHDRGG